MLVLLAFACTQDPPPAPPPTRFEAVQAAPKTVALDGWCDQRDPPAQARPFQWPVLDQPTPEIHGPTWVNVWATWCGPCIAEMPRLVQWRDQMAKEGVEGNLVFLSVDAQAADVARFEKQHPELAPGVRLHDDKDLAGWLPTVGLDANVAIPLHFFLDGSGKIRCERSGAIGENDYEDVKAALQGP